MVQKNQHKLNVIKHRSTIPSIPHTWGDSLQLDQSQTQILHKFVRLCMKNGKKTKSHFILAKTLTQIGHIAQKQTPMGSMDRRVNGSVVCKMHPIRFLMKAIDNVKPQIEVTKMRLAGSTQFVPKMIPQNRQESLAIRWLIQAAQSQKRRHAIKKTGHGIHRSDASFVRGAPDLADFLVAELIDAFNQVGSVHQKRDELHQLAEANRGFSHYRWW